MTDIDALFERIEAERKAWPIWKKARMWFKWNVAQPVRKFPREVRWFIQRGRRGWSDYDMWSMDSHIARLNIEMLARLREIAHGYPGGLTDGVDEPWYSEDDRVHFAAQNALIDAQIGFEGGDGFERWKAMLAYFEEGWRGAIAYIDDYEKDGHERFKAMMPLYAEWFGGLWD
jgi:hypothetical protein